MNTLTDSQSLGPVAIASIRSIADDRNATIAAIRTALRRRSGKAWSVTGGRGTAWGWINIEAPPARRVEFGYTSPAECAELGELLGKERPVHFQGESIAASSDYRRVAICRALYGHPGPFTAEPYWD